MSRINDALCTELYSAVGLWTQTDDVHGWDGVAHDLATVDECKEACINDSQCVAIDWDPSNVARTCWTLSSTRTSPTHRPGFITHYQLNRDLLRETYTVVQKNATTLADYNYDSVQSILIIFSKLFANDHKSCLVVKFSTSPHTYCHYTL